MLLVWGRGVLLLGLDEIGIGKGCALQSTCDVDRGIVPGRDKAMGDLFCGEPVRGDVVVCPIKDQHNFAFGVIENGIELLLVFTREVTLHGLVPRTEIAVEGKWDLVDLNPVFGCGSDDGCKHGAFSKGQKFPLIRFTVLRFAKQCLFIFSGHRSLVGEKVGVR